MSTKNARFLSRASRLSIVAALLAAACTAEGTTKGPANIPAMPTPMPGQASLGGHALDANGQVVQGAVIKIAETDAKATTDANGAYQLAVPSDSTLTLTASATGMATTFRESVVLTSGAMVSVFDMLLLPTAEMDAITSVLPSAQDPTRGVVAVRLHSMTSSCALAGAHITVSPPSAATVVYSAPSQVSGGLDMPSTTAQEVQPGTEVAAWLLAALPPGNMNLLRIDVQQTGCALVSPSPSLDGVMFPGLREVAAKSLTEADLFLQ